MRVGLGHLKVTGVNGGPEKLTWRQRLLEGRAPTAVLSLLLYTKEQFYYCVTPVLLSARCIVQ